MKALLIIALTCISVHLQGQTNNLEYNGLFIKNDSTIALDSLIRFTVQNEVYHLDEILIAADKMKMESIKKIVIEGLNYNITAFHLSTDSSYNIAYIALDGKNAIEKIMQTSDVIICESDVKMADLTMETKIDDCMRGIIDYALKNEKNIYLFIAISAEENFLNMSLKIK